jgi:hypothetical protein
MKAFLHRNVIWISVAAILLAIACAILTIFVVSAKDLQNEILRRVDRVSATDLPGPKNQISERSKTQIDTLIKENPHAIGAWVAKNEYEKTENPVIFYVAKDPIINTLMTNYAAKQASGNGFSSSELNASSAQSLRNSEEAKTGLIRCGPLDQTNVPKLVPDISKHAKGICRATIPPFDENVNIAIVVPINIPANENTPEIQAIRRMLLQLQIDIFNRDYQGRETWARPL